MLSKKQQIVIYIFLILGVLVAAKLYHIDYMVNYSGERYESFCNINERFNCDAVASSPYSRLFGVPIAFIGMMANIFLILFLWIGNRFKTLKEHIKEILLLVLIVYVVVCIVLAIISFLFISSLCFVCMSFWAIMFLCLVYIATISEGAWKTPLLSASNALKSIWAHRWIVGFMVIAFIIINVVQGYWRLNLRCANQQSNPFQCEHFDMQSHVAYLGRESAKIDVFVYTDFQCPWCRRAHYAIVDLMKKYEDRIRFIRKEFPLDMECNDLIKRPFHNVACKAAFYSKCAGLQGKYWQYHDEILNNQEILSEEIFINIGKMLSLDVRELQECAQSKTVREIIKKEIEEGKAFSIEGTPTFRIFGELIMGMINEQTLNDYLDSYPSIRPEVLHRMLFGNISRSVQIIDIRDEDEYQNGHIDSAVNVPLRDLKDNLMELPINTKRPTLIYDANGSEVSNAFSIFKKMGVAEIRTLQGGYESWLKRSREIL